VAEIQVFTVEKILTPQMHRPAEEKLNPEKLTASTVAAPGPLRSDESLVSSGD